MNKRDWLEAKKIEKKLMKFHEEEIPLSGIQPFENMFSFLAQIIDSLHRVRYVKTIRNRQHSIERENPESPLFDPLKAAILNWQRGDVDEAFWLVYLATHCGRNLRTSWLLSSELYGALNMRPKWTWQEVSNAPQEFSSWLAANHLRISGKFGNHRKYESLKPGKAGTGAAVESYVDWVMSSGSHIQIVDELKKEVGSDPRILFRAFYDSMTPVRRFGRTGRFDYLTMLSKLSFAPIEADSPYMVGATGPVSGARLFFDGAIQSATASTELERRLVLLDASLGLGMQVWEDALCNWQKSPGKYVHFKG